MKALIFKNLLGDLLLEASKKDVLIKKLGVNEYNAEALSEIAGPLSVFFAYKILEKYEVDYYDNLTPERKKEVLSQKSAPDRFALVNGSNSFVNQRNKMRGIMDWVRVGLNGNINPYKNLTFDELYDESERWHESLGVGESKIDYKETHDIIIDFRNKGIGFYWVSLGKTQCPDEAERMGHCARSSGILYSLREYKEAPNNHTFNKSYLTASIDGDGILLQLKGQKNSKPDSEYHPYILALLKYKGNDEYLIDGFGYEYDSKNDFKLSDLTDEEIKKLYEERPELFNSRQNKKLLQSLGLIEKPKRENVFVLSMSPNEVQDFIDGSWVIRRGTRTDGRKYEIDLFETILSGDMWDIWQNYDADWSYAVDSISKENEQKIIEILKKYAGENFDPSLSLSEALEEYDDDNNVRIAISSAVNDAEANEYHNYLYKELKSALEEYGKVIRMDDEKVQVEIDLDNHIDDVDEETLDDAYERCEDHDGYSDPNCVFQELLGNYIDKPEVSPDDRWTPWGNDNDFNENLKWRLDEV